MIKIILLPLIFFVAGCGFFWGSFEANQNRYISMVSGLHYTCALLTTGKVRCWGLGTSGTLGHDSTNNIGDGVGQSIIAAGDILVGGTVTQIAGGNSHVCALLTTGSVRCWGSGSSGQLGYNNGNDVGSGVGISITAAGDVPVGGTVTQIAAAGGGNHTCAVLSTGAVRCWGDSIWGQLGHNDTNSIGDGVGLSIIAAGDVPVGGTVTKIAAGNDHTCAVLSTGAVRCWGRGTLGQLGHNDTNGVGDGVGLSIIAAGDVPVGGTVTQIIGGSTHTCAVLSTGSMRCWGEGTWGRLGYNNTNNVGDGVGLSIIAAGDVPVGGTVTQIATGNVHTCAVLSTGSVRCWGFGGQGRLGYNNTNNIGNGVGLAITAAGNVSVGGTVVQVTAGNSHTCAVLSTTAKVRCWGWGFFGRLGYNNTNDVGDGVGLSITAAGDVPLY